MYIHIYIYIYIHILPFICHMYTHINIHVKYIHVYIYISSIYTHTYICIYIHILIDMYIHIYTYIWPTCMNTCINLCMHRCVQRNQCNATNAYGVTNSMTHAYRIRNIHVTLSVNLPIKHVYIGHLVSWRTYITCLFLCVCHDSCGLLYHSTSMYNVISRPASIACVYSSLYHSKYIYHVPRHVIYVRRVVKWTIYTCYVCRSTDDVIHGSWVIK